MRSLYNKYYTKLLVRLLAFTLVALTVFGCKKFVDVDAPVTRANSENVYQSDATAIAVLTGLYSNIMRGTPAPNFVSGTSSFSLLAGLSADEFSLFGNANTTFATFYKNALFVNNTSSYGADYWNALFDFVYFANSAITGLTNSTTGLTPSVKNQLLGEAKFMRAFFYFYLVNLYGDVPLVTTLDHNSNASLPRTPKEQVYQQISQDLKDAEELLSIDFLDGNLQKYPGTPERVRPTKWAAAALLARVYLYANDYVNAEAQSSIVINNSLFSLTTVLNDAFKKNSKEAIWQLQPVNTGRNTDDGRMFVIPSSGFSNNNPVWVSNFLLNSFDSIDQRKTSGNWLKSITISSKIYYYPFKYKLNAQDNTITSTNALGEYLMVLRLAEQYLIRAEARAQQNNIDGAKTDLLVIRNRAGLPNTTANDKNTLLTAILNERQVELFSEWGHRWFDLKRTGKIDAVMTLVTPSKANGATWQSYQQYFPIPFTELQYNSNLSQTSGY